MSTNYINANDRVIWYRQGSISGIDILFMIRCCRTGLPAEKCRHDIYRLADTHTDTHSGVTVEVWAVNSMVSVYTETNHNAKHDRHFM